ncbi:MAG: hypothetical protein A3F41_06325 [Coxiella sp. RIFCSPHIGHO2_12_FULL_44_14]|nr:MAG: hypothetical protein A3F41_06325 [Coxiella sp. RIFCSPHIGHO2_12_FULL_44_14]
MPINKEFRVNTNATGTHQRSSVANLEDGGYLVTWTNGDGKNQAENIYARGFDNTSNPRGPEFQVNTIKASYQTDSAVAGLKPTGAVVTWSRRGNSWSVYAQCYDASLKPVNSEFLVNTNPFGWSADVAGLAEGGFAIVWESLKNADYDIYARFYDKTCHPLTPDIQVNNYTIGDQRYSTIAGLTKGGAIILWASANQHETPENVYGRSFNSLGQPLSEEFKVNTDTSSHIAYPCVAAVSEGGFVATWDSIFQNGSSTWDVYAQRFDGNATPNKIGPEFRVNAATGELQDHSTVAGLAGGGFTVTWQRYWNHWNPQLVAGIFDKNYDANGVPVKTQFQVGSNNVSYSPSIAGLKGGDYVVTWDSGENDAYNIYAKQLENPLKTLHSKSSKIIYKMNIVDTSSFPSVMLALPETDAPTTSSAVNSRQPTLPHFSSTVLLGWALWELGKSGTQIVSGWWSAFSQTNAVPLEWDRKSLEAQLSALKQRAEQFYFPDDRYPQDHLKWIMEDLDSDLANIITENDFIHFLESLEDATKIVNNLERKESHSANTQCFFSEKNATTFFRSIAFQPVHVTNPMITGCSQTLALAR